MVIPRQLVLAGDFFKIISNDMIPYHRDNKTSCFVLLEMPSNRVKDAY